MQHIRHEELAMFKHTAEVMNDRLCDSGDEYSDNDSRAVDHIDDIGKSGTSALVLTGQDLSIVDCNRLMDQIVRAEVAHWVPNASQRLIRRAGLALGFSMHRFEHLDHGAELRWHAVVRQWQWGTAYLQCVDCGRLFAEEA
jgi:hypothetical protein